MFLSQTVPVSGYYGIETLLPFVHNLKTWSIFVTGVLEVKNNHNTVILCNLTREACSPYVLKHTTSYAVTKFQ